VGIREQSSRLAVVLVVVSAVVWGCAGGRPPGQADTQIPIAGIETIAGKWAGLVDRVPSREDWIELLINDDSSFQFTGSRTIGMLQGKGKLTLREGQGFSESDRGRAIYRLYDRGGKRVLRVEVVETNGLRYAADLTR
jgi:hypothetical protein